MSSDSPAAVIVDPSTEETARVSGGAVSVTSNAWPVDPGKIINAFLEQAAAVPDKADLRVDGSGTPIDFEYVVGADDICICGLSLVMAASKIAFGGLQFANLILTNGLLLIYNPGTPLEIRTFKVNEDLVHFASPGGFDFVVASTDVAYSTVETGGALKLVGGSGAKIVLRVRDNLSVGIQYLKFQIRGFKGS